MMIVHEIPEKDVGSALGLVGSAGYVGLSSSPSIAGFIVYYASWRYTFLFIVILCIIQFSLLLKVKKEWFGEKESIDYVGSIVYLILMIIFTIGLIKLTKYGIYLLVISAVLLALLIKIEKSKENPIINLSLLNNLKYEIGTFAAMTMYFITFIAVYILNLYLQLHLGFDQRTAGLMLLITPLVMIFVSPVAGKLTAKYDSRVLSAIALTVLLITMAILFSMANIPFYIIIIAIILQGIGHGLFSAPNNKYTLTLVDKDRLADATSILATSKEFGKNLSLAVYTVVCAIFTVDYHNLTTFRLSFHVIFIISISLTVLAIILLIYSRIKFEDEENIEVLNFLKSVIGRK